MTVRPPSAAGVWYPSSAALLAGQVNDFFDAVPEPSPRADCLVVPHCGLSRMGAVAAAGYASVTAAQRRVVVLCPAHDDVEGILLSGATAFGTPLGLVDTVPARELLGLAAARVDDRQHAAEAGIEVQLPFLLNRMPALTLLPVLVGRASPADVSALFDAVWDGPETLVVVSTNVHDRPAGEDGAGPDRAATAARVLERLVAGDDTWSAADGCGWRLLAALAATVRRRGLTGSVLAVETVPAIVGEATASSTCMAIALAQPEGA